MNKIDVSIGTETKDFLRIVGEVENGVLIKAEITADGCLPFLRKVDEIRESLPSSIRAWRVESDFEHVELLLHEIQLRLLGEWSYPYQHQELCHCRVVATDKVDCAIVNGAKTVSEIAQVTSAGTGCGTCVADIEKIIEFRRSKN